MKDDYRKCLKKLRKNVPSINMAELENNLIDDSPGDELYFVTKYLYRRIYEQHETVSEKYVSSVCQKYPDYEWWAKCVKEIKDDSESYEIYVKQDLADRLVFIFDYYHSEILSKQILQRLSGDPPSNMPRSDLLPPTDNLTPPSQQSHNPEHHITSEEKHLVLPDELNTERVVFCLNRAIDKGYIRIITDKRLEWLGDDGKQALARLAYFCGLIFGYKIDSHTNGNAGGRVPYIALERLFNVKRLDRSLRQVYDATKPQRWRSLYDNLLA